MKNQLNVEYIQQALKQAAHEVILMLYSPGIDPFLGDLANGADRVLYFEEGQETYRGYLLRLAMRDQKTCEDRDLG